MNGYEFRCLRELIGLPRSWVAEVLDVEERSIRRWEMSGVEVPEFAAGTMTVWTEDSKGLMADLWASVERHYAGQEPVYVAPISAYPHSFYRNAVGAVLARCHEQDLDTSMNLSLGITKMLVEWTT